MRVIIMVQPGCERPEDLAALKAYLFANIPARPSELVTLVPKGQPGRALIDAIGAEFGVPVSTVPAGVARFADRTPEADGPSNPCVDAATFIDYGDAVCYAMDDLAEPMAFVVGSQPTEGAKRLRQVCQTYEVPCHFVRVQPTHLDMPAARDITPQVQVVQQPAIQQASLVAPASTAEPYIFPQSHSSLNVFLTCPRQYEAKYITRECPYVQSDDAKWGDDAHKELENYLRTDGAHVIQQRTFKDQNMLAYRGAADWVLRRAHAGGAKVLAERSLAVTKDLAPTSYRDKGRWLGGKIDVTLLYPTNCAEVFDWKTGKMKDDRTQLQLYGGFTLAAHPEITQVGSGYIWLKDGKMSPPSFYMRPDFESLFAPFREAYAKLREAYIAGVFPATPNGLCKQWCDVKSCEYWGKGRR
jgi:hypothetical protein